MLDTKIRYLQIAFNYDVAAVSRILPTIPFDEHIFIEAGTPFIKKEGSRGIRYISRLWRGIVVADTKVCDGAVGEVDMAHQAGADAATVIGNAPPETIDLFIQRCKEHKMISMIDMVGVANPLKVVFKTKYKPDVVVLHKGRDEEETKGKTIPYKHINKIRSKYDCLISAAGGVDLKESRSAIFNGANIVVVNIVRQTDPWQGIASNANIAQMARQFLKTIE
ncbi:hypothetical protein JW766_01335 [Candidatus Dojkabacteria bacterium]|nr:hypothetical protein [Candidatus Dojkabacteria bacterium]